MKRSYLILLIGLAIIVAIGRYGLDLVTPPVHTDLKIQIPKQTAWVDFGRILDAGVTGDWDLYLWGGFTASAVKHEGLYYLYYQGASGYQTGANETVTGRTIGVAISEDGINFKKVGSNPVMRWSPGKAGEEGAVSGSVFVADDVFFMTYGANSAENDLLVTANGRLARSRDGISFNDTGIVLNHADANLWGSGDEIFPVLSFADAGRWFTYYIPNGTENSGQLGVAWGNTPDDLTQSSAVRSGLATIEAWGTASAARVAANTYALFLSHVRSQYIDVRTVSLDHPNQVSTPIVRYTFPEGGLAAVLLDNDINTWFMYYRIPDNPGYGVRIAPAGPLDHTPPTTASNLTLTKLETGHLLTWGPAFDPETGVAAYNIYIADDLIATVRDTKYVLDSGDDNARYAVAAINYHNVEGERRWITAESD